jgi:hypothetical protein
VTAVVDDELATCTSDMLSIYLNLVSDNKTYLQPVTFHKSIVFHCFSLVSIVVRIVVTS